MNFTYEMGEKACKNREHTVVTVIMAGFQIKFLNWVDICVCLNQSIIFKQTQKISDRVQVGLNWETVVGSLIQLIVTHTVFLCLRGVAIATLFDELEPTKVFLIECLKLRAIIIHKEKTEVSCHLTDIE